MFDGGLLSSGRGVAPSHIWKERQVREHTFGQVSTANLTQIVSSVNVALVPIQVNLVPFNIDGLYSKPQRVQ